MVPFFGFTHCFIVSHILYLLLPNNLSINSLFIFLFFLKGFLKHSPCFHSKVFKTSEFKNTCNNPFLYTVGKIDLNHINADNAHEAVCCGFNTWFECTFSTVKQECQTDGGRVIREFHNHTLGPITDLLCPVDIFPVSSSACKKVFNSSKPKSGGKPPENMITKLIVQLVPFLFDKN